MALSATSKNQLNNLLSLLSIDPTLTLRVKDSAERLLSPTNQTYVKAILAKDPNGAVNAAATTALNALLTDISEN